MRFAFSWKVTVVCTILIALMLRASYWQYTRYVEKNVYLAELAARLEMPIEPADSAMKKVNKDWKALLHRRLLFQGSWDYDHEVILRNRKIGNLMGGHVLTPLRTAAGTILVSRGFIPMQMMGTNERKIFHNGPATEFVGLVKEASEHRLFAPRDPPSGPDLPWVDQWLRVDIGAIQKQLTYPLAPVYVEMMPKEKETVSESDLVLNKSNRDEILFMPGAGASLESIGDIPKGSFPVPTFDTIVPAARHYSYIFEWAIMALMTAIIAAVLQLKRNS